MKIITWNVNGLRSAQRQGLVTWLKKYQPDILCLQEIKVSSDKLPENLKSIKGYNAYFSHAQKPGYSGTAVYAKQEAEAVICRMGFKQFDDEGRFIQLEFKKFILMNVYMPHGGRQKEKLGYKLSAYKKLFTHLQKIKSHKPVILLGDFNVAHEEIDLARPKQNRDNIMFTPLERKQIDQMTALKMDDSLRLFHNEGGYYTWWPYMANARARNLGWRIDYIFVASLLRKNMIDAFTLPEVRGSDHCPGGIDISL